MERDVEEVRAEAPRRVGAGGIDEEVEHDALAAHAAGGERRWGAVRVDGVRRELAKRSAAGRARGLRREERWVAGGRDGGGVRGWVGVPEGARRRLRRGRGARTHLRAESAPRDAPRVEPRRAAPRGETRRASPRERFRAHPARLGHGRPGRGDVGRRDASGGTCVGGDDEIGVPESRNAFRPLRSPRGDSFFPLSSRRFRHETRFPLVRRLRARARASGHCRPRAAHVSTAPARRDALPRDASARGDGRRHARAADRFHQKQPARRSRHAGANDAGTRAVPPGCRGVRAAAPSSPPRPCADAPDDSVHRARSAALAASAMLVRPPSSARPRRAPGAKRPRAGVTPLRAFSRGNLRSDARGASLGAQRIPPRRPPVPSSVFIRPPDDPLTPPPPPLPVPGTSSRRRPPPPRRRRGPRRTTISRRRRRSAAPRGSRRARGDGAFELVRRVLLRRLQIPSAKSPPPPPPRARPRRRRRPSPRTPRRAVSATRSSAPRRSRRRCAEKTRRWRRASTR